MSEHDLTDLERGGGGGALGGAFKWSAMLVDLAQMLSEI